VMIVDFYPELGRESVASLVKVLTGIEGLENKVSYHEVPLTGITQSTTVASLVVGSYSRLEHRGQPPDLIIVTPLITPCYEIANANGIPMERLPEVVIAQGRELAQLTRSRVSPARLIVCHPVEWGDFIKHDCRSWIPRWLYLAPDNIRNYGWLLKSSGCGDDNGYKLLDQNVGGLFQVVRAKTGAERREAREGR
jgi:hypothetical protein